MINKRRLVIITDCSDVAYNELRGTAPKILADNDLEDNIEIEPVVSVEPFSIINGSFILRLMAEAYPAGTAFLVISTATPLPKNVSRFRNWWV